MMKVIFGFFLLAFTAHAAGEKEIGERAIRSLTGCYLVDYSYTETESLKPGYQRDSRVYDVNQNKSVKEWIYATGENNKIRLQHVLFATDLQGQIMADSLLKHTGEDWEYEAPFQYEFTAPLRWEVKPLERGLGRWTRKITNLDDGLRYQCSAAWLPSAYPEWSCDDNYAPIPGRETRDMGRKDYQALLRSTKIVAYGHSWLERQANTKMIHQEGVKTPLAKELGKNWYVRLPESDCDAAKAYISEWQPFWSLLQETWETVLVGDRAFYEKSLPGQSRYMQMMAIGEEYKEKDLSNSSIRKEAQQKILALIQKFREN